MIHNSVLVRLERTVPKAPFIFTFRATCAEGVPQMGFVIEPEFRNE